jgi:hypothetical protein
LLVASPNGAPIGPGNRNYLQGVTCASGSDCWAVGSYLVNQLGGDPATLIEHWHDGQWTIVTSPNLPLRSFLQAVTCVSANDCWAVGYSYDVDFVTLIEHWDGTSWAITVSPNAPATDSFLQGIICASASDCWAVGYSYVNTSHGIIDLQMLIEHWDGTLWSITTLSNVGTLSNTQLNGVACVSASDCWAVGTQGSNSVGTLTEHWDGISWTVVSSPGISAENILNGITCTSMSDCWTAGYFVDASGISHTLTEHWDGTSWSVVASPNRTDKSTQTAPEVNYLNGVTCTSASDCWAFGASNYLGQFADGTSSGFKVTLIEHWDGTSWSIVSSGNNADQIPGFPSGDVVEYNDLASLTCASASDCWAVGNFLLDFGNGQDPQTLVEKYTPNLPPVALDNAASTKVHGGAGSFNIDLPITGNPGIECRSGGANGDYTLVFTFANYLSSVDVARVTSGTGTVTSSNIGSRDTHQYFVNLSGVTNAQTITVTLANVFDVPGNASTAISAPMGVLLGDVNASGRVDAADVSLVRQQTLQPVTASNFREDVNASGRIDAADVSIARQQTLTSLP